MRRTVISEIDAYEAGPQQQGVIAAMRLI